MGAQILLFSQPRSASHMLERMFEKQDDLEILTHPFSSSRGIQLKWMQSESYKDGIGPDALSGFNTEVKKGIAAWRNRLSGAESNGTKLMVHTHLCYPLSPGAILPYFDSFKERKKITVSAQNCTVIPDDLLLHPGTTPVFTIRDPRLAIPSAHRVMQSMGLEHGAGELNFFTVTCLIWHRMIYDFYISKGITPLVFDADDYITDANVVHSLCLRIGLDPDKLQLSWAAVTSEEKKNLHPMLYASQSKLFNSSGPDPARAAKNINMETEMERWDEEFGEDAALMRRLVEVTMPHHEYLREKRTTHSMTVSR